MSPPSKQSGDSSTIGIPLSSARSLKKIRLREFRSAAFRSFFEE
jgi:hypothetical protein